MKGITSTGFALKILPAGVEIFSANIVYVKDPEFTLSNRIGDSERDDSGTGRKPTMKKKEENTLTKEVRSTGASRQGKRYLKRIAGGVTKNHFLMI